MGNSKQQDLFEKQNGSHLRLKNVQSFDYSLMFVDYSGYVARTPLLPIAIGWACKVYWQQERASTHCNLFVRQWFHVEVWQSQRRTRQTTCYLYWHDTTLFFRIRLCIRFATVYYWFISFETQVEEAINCWLEIARGIRF